MPDIDNIRKLGLFEGTDEYGRILPQLGVAENTHDEHGDPVTFGPLGFDASITERPFLGDTELWQIFNFTADAHPYPEDSGAQDTSWVWPHEIIGIAANFDIAGEYLWRCHILSHEDHDMMRPYDEMAAISALARGTRIVNPRHGPARYPA